MPPPSIPLSRIPIVSVAAGDYVVIVKPGGGGDGLALAEDLSGASVALGAILTNIAALTGAADKFIYFTGATTVAVSTVSAAARALLDDPDSLTMRATLGLVIGTDVAAASHTHAFSALTGKPTTISGYGITDALLLGSTSLTAAAGDHVHAFSVITGKPTTLAGYGITDGALAAALNASALSTGTVPTARFPNGGFNGVSQLVQTDSSGRLPALDGSQLTGLSSGFANPMTTLGDLIYGGVSGAATRVAGNTTSTRKFLRSTGSGGAATAPAYDTVLASDVGLGSVENVAISVWTGSTSIETLGEVLTGTWHAAAIDLASYSTGILPNASFPATLPAASGVNLTDLNASNLLSGTVPAARIDFSGYQTLLTNSAGLRAALSDETGTGSAVFANTPTLVTPVLGVATATSINKVQIIAPASGSQLDVGDGQSLSTRGAFGVFLRFSAASDVTFPLAGTLATLAGTETLTNKSINASQLTGTVAIARLASGTPDGTKFIRDDGVLATPAGGGSVANPTGTIGLTAVNGVAASAMRSDGAPALSQAIAPTWTAAHAWSVAGAANTPAAYLTGALYTGGTGTTAFPHLFIQPSGATAATSWITGGTGVGMNLPLGFAGNMADFRIAGVSKFSVDNNGAITAPNIVAVSTVTCGSTGAFAVAGRGYLESGGADGLWRMANLAETGFTGLNFGTNTSSSASLRTSGTAITFGKADGTSGGSVTASGTLAVTGTTALGADVTLTAANLIFATAGKGLQLKSGTGARAGNATLVAGTVTVTNTTVSANTIAIISRKTAGGTIGNLTYTLSAGASFTINSDNALDTSVVSFHLIELN